MTLLPARDHSIDHQQYQGTEDGDAKAAQIKLLHRAKAKLSANPAADRSTDHTKDDGEETATRVFARHQKFSNTACEQAENNP